MSQVFKLTLHSKERRISFLPALSARIYASKLHFLGKVMLLAGSEFSVTSTLLTRTEKHFSRTFVNIEFKSS